MPRDRGPRPSVGGPEPRHRRTGGGRAGSRGRPTRGGEAASGIVAGRRAVLEAIRAGVARSVVIARGSRATSGLREVIAEADRQSVPVREDDHDRLDELAEDHRGVIAIVRTPTPLDERALSETAFADDAVAVVLDGVEDPQNLGAAARAAEAAGVAMLVSRTRRAADVTDAAVRASAGALLHLPHARVANISRALERLKGEGFAVVGLDAAGTSIYEEPAPDGRIAIVLGAEGSGLSRLVREACDVTVALPMLGRVGSLNASNALAAVLYGWVLPPRRRPRPAAGA